MGATQVRRLWSNTAHWTPARMSRLPDFSAVSHPVRRRLRFARLWPPTPPVAVALSALLAVGCRGSFAAAHRAGGRRGAPGAGCGRGALAGTLSLGLLLVRLSVDHEQGRHLAAAAGAMDPVTGVVEPRQLPVAGRTRIRTLAPLWHRLPAAGRCRPLPPPGRHPRRAAGDMMLREIAASTQANAARRRRWRVSPRTDRRVLARSAGCAGRGRDAHPRSVPSRSRCPGASAHATVSVGVVR